VSACPAGAGSFGEELVAALVGPDLAASCRAAGVLSHMLDGNGPVKRRLLSVPLEIPKFASSAPPAHLMPRCVAHLSRALGSDGATDRQTVARVWAPVAGARLRRATDGQTDRQWHGCGHLLCGMPNCNLVAVHWTMGP
jgi:hypothetical protein